MKNKLHVRIEPTDLELLKKVAKETRRTMSSLFYEALEIVIKKYSKAKK